MDKKKETLARFGIATKGFVYTLIGVLTFIAAIGMGGSKSDSGDALKFLEGNLGGTILLGIATLGLVAYVFWRFYQAIKDPENKGNDFKGIFNRLGYFSSGFFYSFLAFSAVEMLLGTGGGSGGGRESYIAKALSKPYGQVIVVIIASIFLGKAIYQMIRAFTESYQKKVRAQDLPLNAQKMVLLFGKIGYTSRGIVIGVIAFLTYRAAYFYNSEEAGGTKDAFSFLQNEFGSIVLLAVALGLTMYGLFMIIKGIYRDMTMA